MGLILIQKLRLGETLTAQFSFEIVETFHLQLPIQFLQASHLRNRHHEIQPGVFHDTFHDPFLIAPTYRAEVVIEEVVAFQLLKMASQDPFVHSGNLCHEGFGVVVTDPPRNTAEILEGADMAFPDKLRALPLEHLHVEGV